MVFLALLVAVAVTAGSGVGAYGLTWDEPTYFHYAGLQRDWLKDVVSGLLSPSSIPPLFARETIDRVWLQHPELNGHPPLNETWMGLAGEPFRIFGRSEIESFRSAISLLLGLTAALLFALMRASGYSAVAALGASLVYLGTPAIWAHGHLGATETMQNFFWALLALILPQALTGRRVWVWAWFFACGLAFMGKFTNLLAPVWVLGAAALMGALRMRRFWVCALLAAASGPILLLLLDPFFWPWNDGLGRLADYIRQTTTRADWVPIEVYYMGRTWGFSPPWHYRIVQTAVSLPLPVLALVLAGLAVSFRRLLPAAKKAWGASGFCRSRVCTGPSRAPLSGEGPAGVSWRDPAWPMILGLCGLGVTFVVGMVPATPNHDGTRQFIHVFFATALIAGVALQWLRDRLRSLTSHRGREWLGRWIAAPVLALPLWAFGISVACEPWGLSYHGEWMGGARGAWERGFELSYWMETVTPRMVAATLRIPPREGTLLRVHTVPKLDYFTGAEGFIRPILPEDVRARRPLARDVMPAFFSPWAEPLRASEVGPILSFSFAEAIDAVQISYRRATVAEAAWNYLHYLSLKGELILLEETRVDNVPLARLYGVRQIEEVRIPWDPDGRVWYQFPSLARHMELVAGAAAAGDGVDSMAAGPLPPGPQGGGR